jgi:hypothetical protein
VAVLSRCVGESNSSNVANKVELLLLGATLLRSIKQPQRSSNTDRFEGFTGAAVALGSDWC